jgi:peptidoglycan/LPS O-acetylase OafA/YrhL
MESGRLESLDIVRGVAALVVVLHHWDAFYWTPGAPPVDIYTVALPFGRVSLFFCKYGYLAVDVFFCLSGFIFTRLYAEAIETGHVGAGKFTLLRFSRLYPLHLATLLMVVAINDFVIRKYGVAAGRGDDTAHFFLQLVFASDWWPDSPLTFNGPVWSVSIEVLLYALFFVLAKGRALRLGTAVLAVLIGFSLLSSERGGRFWSDDDLGRGVSMFYMGAIACWLVDAIKRRKGWRALAAAIGLIAIVGLVIMKGTGGRGYAGWFLMVFGFPGLIVTLALIESRIEHLVRPLRWLGSISYSTYLLHTPLFILVVLLGWARTPASLIFFFLVMATLILVSLASFHFFELPMQQLLRGVSTSPRTVR